MTALGVNERQQLAQSVRAACLRLSPEGRVRALAYDGGEPHRGFDAELWRVLCGQVGVAAIGLPERCGGAGYGATALGVVAHELGRSLACVPFVASAVLATSLLLAVDDPEADDRVSALSEGTRTAAAALTEDGGLWHRDRVSVSAVHASAGWTISGVVRHVVHGGSADDLIIVALAGDELALFILDARTHGVTISKERVLDGTRPMATLTFTSAPATRLSSATSVEDVVSGSVDLALAVLSAEQVGACERVLEIATDYARTREQFSRPIGSFQAIKHKCADMLLDLELARSASQAALDAHDVGPVDESAWRASMAKAMCSESLRNAAHANVQIHGGIGFTWEDSAHLYLRRARTDEVLFGKPAEHWERLGSEAKIV
ncbi:acyl-CoA dehydrogenase [Mycobacterium malmoense]|uniref:acyl-CoA dehydrogenase family protein n=1 Tax=Mycobacterium malmoense TaxID=1780 RepID=UPI00080BF7DC|nr:acyl-CoA dehydrogenase family protein [Mycobacterium malmoense]OCB24368.1 acyl-CoA dehydrogenase [Mycobacterium malmoense]